MMMLIIMCVAIIFTGLSLLTSAIGIGLWISGTILLRQMAKKDPQMTRLFLRYWNRYRQPYYAPAARPGSRGHRSSQ